MDIEIICPHCGGMIVVNVRDINCAIFRHAVYKVNMQPIPPHESKEKCKEFFDSGIVYGCAQPFKIIKENEKYIAIICDYI